MADLYKIIDELLKEKGISGAKMSSDLGMSRSFMTELRKGRAKSIKTETAKKIADYFGVSTDYLLGNVSEPYFHLDDSRILREINSYVDEEKKAPTSEGERKELDSDLEIIQRERSKMTDKEKTKLMNILRANFDDYNWDADDSGNIE